jgi:small subunit ribosomal protein S6
MFVLNSGRFATDPSGAEESLVAMFDRLGAQIVAKSPWQDGKLAYPINGHRKGLHYLVYFQMDTSQVQEMHRLCRLNDLVLRHLVIEHPDVLFTAMSQALVQHGHQSGESQEATAAVS